MKKIYIGSDHAGFALKEKVKIWLSQNKLLFEDLGNMLYDKDDDYPDYAAKVGRKVAADKSGKSKGLLFCGSAEGICIAANKIKGIRAVAVWQPLMAKQSRLHNNTNVLCLSGGETLKKIKGMGLPLNKTVRIIQAFLNTSFSGAHRHKRRIEKIRKLERQ